MRQSYFSWSISILILISANQAFATGSPRPDNGTTNPSEPSTPTPTPTKKREFNLAKLVDIKSNFDLTTLSLPKLTPSCLRKNNFELIAIDPGHDDSSASRRSDAMVRGGNGKFVFLWPKVHEGQLNMVTALLMYHYIVSNPALSSAEKSEIAKMVRLSRYPGEKRFGEYEIEAGYTASSVGSIDDTVTNRRNRVNQMIRSHRAPTSTSSGWAGSTTNVQEKTIFLSVHANSTSYFDEGDYGWMIPPNTTSISTLTGTFQSALASGFGTEMFSALKPLSSDDSEVSRLKNAVFSVYQTPSIRKGKHSDNLAMLSTSLGTAKTLKVLSEGFVMNGKVGHIANIELNAASPKWLQAYRDGEEVFEYGYSTVYDAYAKSLVSGLSNLLKCD
ncbi:MAG TPA: hypothetical protein VM901_06510 [Bdellovibrionota bacterium]|jgi:hypothetical protein|nr:hypothetical protein [Bdellovibrionota bacterium]